jgi:hypothetical protein
MAKLKSTVFERGDRLYIVSEVSPIRPTDEEIAEFAFSQELMKQAPNPAIKWLQGQYVEADKPNRNGQQWTEGEVAIKSLTPMFMPVTVMHDTRSAVGLIADTRLQVPERDGVPRARIDNTLAIWGHRFPEVAEEIDINYEKGSLMQSMEALSPAYDCGECGKTFAKLPGGAERANWCEHLKAGEGTGTRILRNVVFTGTGLIFGTQGKTGANPSGHLEVFQEEIAEFHERAHKETRRTGTKRSDTPKRRRKTSMSEIEISHDEYASLRERPSKEEFAAEKQRADKATEDLAEANKKLEVAEQAQKKAEEEKAEVDKKLKEAEEEKAEVTLRAERIGKFGDGFLHKLGETTKKNLTEQAGTMEEDAWESRVAEVEEMAGVKRDAKLQSKKGDEPAKKEGEDAAETSSTENGKTEFSKEELASTVVVDGGEEEAGGGGGSGEPSINQRKSVMRGLIPGREPAKTE